jgi:hypothetical protein
VTVTVDLWVLLGLGLALHLIGYAGGRLTERFIEEGNRTARKLVANESQAQAQAGSTPAPSVPPQETTEREGGR